MQLTNLFYFAAALTSVSAATGPSTTYTPSVSPSNASQSPTTPATVNPAAPSQPSPAPTAKTASSQSTSGRPKAKSPSSLTLAVRKPSRAGTLPTAVLAGSSLTRERALMSWRLIIPLRDSTSRLLRWTRLRIIRLLSLEGLMRLLLRSLLATVVSNKRWTGINDLLVVVMLVDWWRLDV